MEIEDVSRTWINGDLAYVSLATDERVNLIKPNEYIQMTAQREFWMLDGDRSLIHLQTGDLVCVAWSPGSSIWKVIYYESQAPVPPSACFTSPMPSMSLR